LGTCGSWAQSPGALRRITSSKAGWRTSSPVPDIFIITLTPVPHHFLISSPCAVSVANVVAVVCLAAVIAVTARVISLL
jgi:hypothetical protein